MLYRSYVSKFFGVAITLGFLLVLPRLSAQSNVNVRVMAANLNGNSQKYEPFALRLFQGLKPDVVCIQEFNYTSTNGLEVNTPAAFREMVDIGFGTNFFYYREPIAGIPNGVISRYPFITNSYWIDTEVANRGFAWARIDVPGTNDLYVVSVHFLTSSSTARATEANNLKTLMQANFPPNAWIVLAGDFNAGTRTEACITTYSGYLTDFPVPVDNLGNPDTSANRNSAHDYVLPSLSFTNFETASVFPSHSFPNGLVFDSRVYTPLTDVSPVLFGDSSNAQHMAVMKDFLIPVSATGTTNPPAITAQPQNQIVPPGSNATFSVTATGAAPLSYQWRFNSTNISGATTNPLMLTSVQFTNAGNYSVLVTNIAGSVTSAVAVLTVSNQPPGITTQPQNQNVFVGQDANFSVTATGALPLSYQWRFSGTNIPGANANAYTRTNAQTNDAGNYLVVITNISGAITSAVATLTVNVPSTGTLTTLAGWDVSGQSNFGTSPLVPTTNAPNVTVGGLTRGSGVATPAGAAARGWGGTGFTDSTAAAAVSANRFATFTIAANAGYKVSYSAVSKFDYRHSGTGPAVGVLQYQVGAGAFTDITALSYSVATSGGGSIAPIDLSGIAALQNVGAGTTVTFRIVNYAASASGGTWYIFDVAASTAADLSVQGIINPISSPPASPAVLSAPNFAAGQFQMLVTGTASSNYVVQVSTNLSLVNWLSLLTNSSPFTFTDTNPGTAPQRFYRAISLP